MITDSSWKLGNLGGWLYRSFQWVRKGVNISLINFLIREVGNAGSIRALEVGSGSGSGAYYLSKQKCVGKSVALDHDITALKEVLKQGTGVAVVAGDCYQLPFKPDAFQLVWNNSTLEHLQNQVGALAEMRRVVDAGGYVFSGVPFRYGPLFFQPLIAQSKGGQWIGAVFSEKQLTSIFRSAALVPLKSRRYFLNFFIGVLAKKT